MNLAGPVRLAPVPETPVATQASARSSLTHGVDVLKPRWLSAAPQTGGLQMISGKKRNKEKL